MSEELVDLGILPITYMGLFFYYCLPIRKKIIQNNIEIVYENNISPEDKKRLIISFYSHITTSIKEFIHLRLKGIHQFKLKGEVRGIEHLLQAASQGKGVLLLSPHVGNWECAATLLTTISSFEGKFHFIRKSISNKYIEKLLLTNWQEAGLNTISSKGALRKSLSALKKNDGVFFVLDQHSSIDNKEGIAVDFFKKKAGTFISLAALASCTKTPVVPTVCYRENNGRPIVEFFPQLDWIDYPSHEQSLYENTQIYNHALEKMILAHPEQWYWVHRRWKLL